MRNLQEGIFQPHQESLNVRCLHDKYGAHLSRRKIGAQVFRIYGSDARKTTCHVAHSEIERQPLARYQQRMGILQDLEIIERCIAGFVRQDEGIGTFLAPFSRYLQETRARALRSFLKSADDVFEFWPPTRLGPTLTCRQRRDPRRIPDDTQGQSETPSDPQVGVSS